MIVRYAKSYTKSSCIHHKEAEQQQQHKITAHKHRQHVDKNR